MVDAMGETAVSALEKTFELVKTLITKGPMAAWEQLKEMAAEMRDAFIDAVKSFIQQKIIEQAIQWLVSLFIPGAGIIKAVIGIYDTVVFFIQKAKQIMQMISNFLGSISEIAAGNIGAAADAMEKGLARGLSLVINFLAALLRLSGITSKIRDAIQKIRTKVDAVLLKVAKWIADKAKALIKKGVGAVKGAVGKVVQWWRQRKVVTVGKQRATIYFQGEGQKAHLAISSSPGAEYTEYLKKIAGKMTSQAQKDAHSKALKLGAKIESNISSHQMTEGEANTLVADINNMAQLLEIMLSGAAVPPSLITYKPVITGGGGQGAEAKILSPDAAGSKGTEPADDPPIWQAVHNRMNDENKRAYVQGHLLNHNVYGPGKRFNMTPISYKANDEHKRGVEQDVKKFVLDKNQVVYYQITATYGDHPKSSDYLRLSNLAPSARSPLENDQLRTMEADRKLCTQLSFVAYTLKPEGSNWTKDQSISHGPVKNVIPTKAPGAGGAVSVAQLHRLAINNPASAKANKTAKEALLRLPNIGSARADAIIAALAVRSFRSWDDVIAQVSGVTRELVDLWAKQQSPGGDRLVYFHGETIWK
jgi:DNA uptake protein ComE-like DNA-binding protein